MVQAADRRQFGATSTPPSLPALNWRRDLLKAVVDWAPPGAIFVGGAITSGNDMKSHFIPDVYSAKAVSAMHRTHRLDQPAAIMVLAPVLGLAIWIGFLALI
jgi:hypothetical protein